MIDFVLPSLGADMDEGMLVGWTVAPGDRVHRGQVIAEVESDKGIIEIECWSEGFVEELLVAPGPARLRVGTLLARLREPEERVAPTAPAPPAATPLTPAPPPSGPLPPPGKVRRAGRSPAPPVRHLARQLGVDLAGVIPTGPEGTVTSRDVRTAATGGSGGRPRVTPMARRLAVTAGVDLATVTAGRPDGIVTTADLGPPPAAAHDDRAFTGHHAPPVADTAGRAAAMRRAVTRSMSRSKREIPHYYLATDIDMDRAMRWLDDHNAERPLAERVLPAVLLLKAAALALGQMPAMNGHWVDEGFRHSEAVHLGVAVSLREGGLVAPAIHHADHLDLDELMEALRDLVARARTWRLRSSEMSEPTMTVTNLGDRGVDVAFPVIIPPQVAIVGFGRMTERPVAVEGMLAVHPVVTATLAADHRVTDGHTGGLFLAAIERNLQEPEHL